MRQRDECDVTIRFGSRCSCSYFALIFLSYVFFLYDICKTVDDSTVANRLISFIVYSIAAAGRSSWEGEMLRWVLRHSCGLLLRLRLLTTAGFAEVSCNSGLQHFRFVFGRGEVGGRGLGWSRPVPASSFIDFDPGRDLPCWASHLLLLLLGGNTLMVELHYGNNRSYAGLMIRTRCQWR